MLISFGFTVLQPFIRLMSKTAQNVNIAVRVPEKKINMVKVLAADTNETSATYFVIMILTLQCEASALSLKA